ncbi:MAG: hypothetical protein D0531_03855 [Methylococcales bacterium]|nr:MAG: hypothetical protein D0531_03855 [Methylococcales bacterium]
MGELMRGYASETVKVFFLFPLFSKEGVGEIGSIKNNHKILVTYDTKNPRRGVLHTPNIESPML